MAFCCSGPSSNFSSMPQSPAPAPTPPRRPDRWKVCAALRTPARRGQIHARCGAHRTACTAEQHRAAATAAVEVTNLIVRPGSRVPDKNAATRSRYYEQLQDMSPAAQAPPSQTSSYASSLATTRVSTPRGSVSSNVNTSASRPGGSVSSSVNTSASRPAGPTESSSLGFLFTVLSHNPVHTPAPDNVHA
jgi:hypothetical protein